MSFKKDKKEDETIGNTYAALDKTAVLQETRYFNESPVNPKKALLILSRILYIISRGDKLSRTEASDAFFAITKLFQVKDLNLRRMVYLIIKEMAPLIDDIIIVTSSLQKDVNDKDQNLRAPAFRALCKIIEPSMVQMLERHIREGIVSRNSPYAVAAIVSSYHLMKGPCPELIRGFANEVQEAVRSDKALVQYHALGLLYEIRKYGSSGSVLQTLQRYAGMNMKSQYAQCLLIRMIVRYLLTQQQQNIDISNETVLLTYLDSCLRTRTEMVMYEAARGIVNLRPMASNQQRVTSAINVLQVFCSSPRAVYRYAAVRALNNVAMKMSNTSVSFNTDLEALITDSNRSIATLAITTLLKIGSEHNVDRLIKQISTFMSDISDEFKVVVVESIKNLATKYPKKYQSLLNFLSTLLRDNDGYKFKKVVVLTIETIIKEIPDAKSAGLLQLCEFIEDCEHVKLTQRILYLIGQEGPYLPNARKFIRYIYNRIMLEGSGIRCTATLVLARFGAQLPELLPGILVLLNRVSLDEDDEVRDRACLMSYLLTQNSPQLYKDYILLGNELPVSCSALERQLKQYYQCPNQTVKPFDLQQVPAAAIDVITSKSAANNAINDVDVRSNTDDFGDISENVTPAFASAKLRDKYIEELAQISDFKKLGPLFKSSGVSVLMEEDLYITCVKHVFNQDVVLQFNCTNTMKNLVLSDVKVEVLSADGLEDIGLIGCDKLEYNVPGKLYQVLHFTDITSCMVTIASRLLFTSSELNSEGEVISSFEDVYPLDDIDIEINDSVVKVVKPNFDLAWNELGEDNQKNEVFSVTTIDSIADMVAKLEELGLHACEGTSNVSADRSSHVLLLAGKYRGGIEVLINCKIVKANANYGERGLNLLLQVRCTDPDIATVFCEVLL